MTLVLFLIGCSSGDAENVEADQQEYADELEELEEEMGVSEGEDAEIPSLLPADIYLTDDMKIEHTVENDLMSQLNYKTKEDFDELVELYRDYLNSNNAYGEVEEIINEYTEYGSTMALFITEYEGNSFEITLVEDESEEEYRTVAIALYDDEVLDDMLEEIEKQMEEDD